MKTYWFALAVCVWGVAPAYAQDDTSGASSTGDGAGPGSGGQRVSITLPAGAIPQGQATTTTSTPFGFPAPGTDLEGHLGSSSRALSDIHQGDGFDLNDHGASGASDVVRGDPNAVGMSVERATSNTGVYVVRPGDTLSRVSQRLYGQPWEWPKLWSLNPQIQNPHWIYPGDEIRLTAVSTGSAKATETRTLGAGQSGPLRASMDPETIFLRHHAYIDDPDKGVLGELVGALKPVQIMAEGDGVYAVLRPGQSVKAGEVITIFRSSREPPTPRGARRPPGDIVRILGSLRVDYFNPRTRVVRGEIVESLDVIERGSKVGHVERDFRFVAPVPATKNIAARLLTSIYPNQVLGGQQVVFIDRGRKDGLREGNRLFVIRRGDAWRRTLPGGARDAAYRLKMDVPERLQVEKAPLHGDEQEFPEEIVAELRVISTRAFSSLALIVESRHEIVPGDRAVARSGF